MEKKEKIELIKGKNSISYAKLGYRVFFGAPGAADIFFSFFLPKMVIFIGKDATNKNFVCAFSAANFF